MSCGHSCVLDHELLSPHTRTCACAHDVGTYARTDLGCAGCDVCCSVLSSRDEYPKLPAGVEETAKELNRRVFVTFFRMSTPKETAVSHVLFAVVVSVNW